MDTTHRLHVTPSDSGLLYECADGCGRRLAVDRWSGGLTVIDKGDQFARHTGSIGDIDMRPVGIAQG
jgi:hypothetical protein